MAIKEEQVVTEVFDEEEESHLVSTRELLMTELSDGIKLLTDRKGTLNVRKAQEILALENVEYERPVRDEHVAYLATTMKRNTFRPELVAIASAWYDGKLYRMNGQHTSWAVLSVAESNPNVAFVVKFLEYQVLTPKDLNLLYSSFDRNAPRTFGNLIVARLSADPSFGGFSQRTIRLLSDGLSSYLWENRHEARRYDVDARAELMMNDHRTLCLRVGNFLQQADLSRAGKHLKRGPVVGAMFATYKAAVGASDEFWAVVRDGLNLSSKHDPRYKLKFELEQTVVAAKDAGRTKKQVPHEYMYRACIHCWNAWRRKEEMKLLKVPLGSSRPRAV